MELDKIEIVGEHRLFQIREKTDTGEYHRRLISPDKDVSSEVQEIKDKAEEVWTDEVKSTWATHKAEQEAKFKE